jgi:hypothetical protein
VLAQNLAVVLSVDEAGRLLHEHRLLDLPVEEGRLHVHVVDLPQVVPGDAQKMSHGHKTCHQCYNFLEVDPLFLHIAFRYQASFVLHHCSVFIALELVDPLEAYHSVP